MKIKKVIDQLQCYVDDYGENVEVDFCDKHCFYN